MRSVRRQTTQSEVVLEAKLEQLERLVRAKAIVDEHSRSISSTIPRAGLEDTLNPIRTDKDICVPGFQRRKMPARSSVGVPGAMMRGRRTR